MGETARDANDLNRRAMATCGMVHRNFDESLSPNRRLRRPTTIGCKMCQNDSGPKPVSVSAIGASIDAGYCSRQLNYGQLQLRFEDGSVDGNEAPWGPMVSEEQHSLSRIVLWTKGARFPSQLKSRASGKSDMWTVILKTESIRFIHADIDSKNGSLLNLMNGI